MKKRLMSLFLALSMTVSMFPAAFAEDATTPDETTPKVTTPDPSISISADATMYEGKTYSMTVTANDLPDGYQDLVWTWTSNSASVLPVPDETSATATTQTVSVTPIGVDNQYWTGSTCIYTISLSYKIGAAEYDVTAITHTVEVVPVPDMTLAISGPTYLDSGETGSFTASLQNQPDDVTITYLGGASEWTSSNENIAQVAYSTSNIAQASLVSLGGFLEVDITLTLTLAFYASNTGSEVQYLTAKHTVTIAKNATPPDVKLTLDRTSLSIEYAGNTDTVNATVSLSGQYYDYLTDTTYKRELTDYYTKLLIWSINDTNIAQKNNTTYTSATATNPNIGKVALQSKGLSPGQTIASVYIDMNENGEQDSDEPFAEFTITLSGIVLGFSDASVMKYETSDDLLAFGYGNIGALKWSAINPSIVDIEVTDGIYDADANVTISTGNLVGKTSGSTEVTVSNDKYSVSFTANVTDSIAPNIRPTSVVNGVNPLYFSTLISDFEYCSQEMFEDDTLVSLVSIQVPPAQGTLYYGYKDPDNMGAGVATERSYYLNAEPSVKDIVFVPNPYYTGSEVTISYSGKTEENKIFSGEIIFSISEIDDVEMNTSAEQAISLVASQFSAVCTNKLGQSLSHITLHLPTETRGTFYYQYKDEENYHHKIALGEEIYSYEIADVSFIPAPGYTGTLVVPYTGVSTTGSTYPGNLTIYVGDYGDDGPVVYNTRVDEYVTFTTASFEANVQALTGNRLNYVNFTLPSSSQGTLYEDYRSEYNYSRAVSASTTYYATSRSPYIENISFVPAAGFSGVCSIPFTGYDIAGNTYQGTVQINVSDQAQGDINYTGTSGGYVRFYASDFNSLSQQLTESNLDYINFPTLPTSSHGTIRYGQTTTSSGTAVSTGVNFYRTSSSYIDDLTFSVGTTFTGIVEIPFNAVATSGAAFSGYVSIVVANQSVGKIYYNATTNQPAQILHEDLEYLSIERTGSSLDYLRFTLPPASQASLYYNYTSASNNEGLVSAYSSYYGSNSPYASAVSIVPYSTFTGVCEVGFVGYGTNGKQFFGTIEVSVGVGASPLSYTVRQGSVLALDVGDINSYAYTETNSTLNYITVNLPTTTQGTLYQTYSSTNSYNPKATSTTKYYRGSTPSISNLVFVPNTEYLGTFTIGFTATSLDGSVCTGNITIEVLPQAADKSISYSTTYSALRFNVSDLYNAWSGDDISYIVFDNMPTSTQGKLYYANNLSALAYAGVKYYVEGSPNFDDMIFAPRAGFYGTIVLTYTATTENGGIFVGDIYINVNQTTASTYFGDMGSYSWAAAAADYLNVAGVTSGVGVGIYGPGQSITRGDFALMLSKAFSLSTTSTVANFDDVPATAYYYTAVQTLRALGVVTGSDNKFSPTSYISRQDAMMMLYQAMNVANRQLTVGTDIYLALYQDGSSVASYAQVAMATMIRNTIISGDTNGNLNPTASMTRAEMAVVLHKAMTT